MRKRRIAVAIIAILALVIGTWALLPPEKEPLSGGKPLSYWVLRDDRKHEISGQKAEADTAIRDIGTNGLPLLLKWVQHKQPRWRRFAWTMSLKLPTRWVADTIRESRADILAENSANALRALGPEAAPITGQLILLLTNPVGSDIWMRADVVLVNSSTNALPAVTAALTDPTKTYARGPLLATIRSMRPPQEVARPLVPLMIQLMDQKPYPEMAALTLGVLRAEPQASAPALVRFLDNPQRLGRYYAICALTNFPSQAEIILPALTNALSDTNQLVRRSASNSIQSIVAEAQPQLPR